MKDYTIFTDSACDIPCSYLKAKGIECIELSCRFNESDIFRSQSGEDIRKFYHRMKNGEIAKTSAANPVDFYKQFEINLKNGKDVLYLGFSSALSSTFASANLAVKELKKDYQENKIVLVDTLCSSAGIALLKDMVISQKERGASIEEAALFAEKMKLKICHAFTVDDLAYLMRGGRITKSTALLGNLLGVKPILHVDNDGKLTQVGKVRGRQASILRLAEEYQKKKDPMFNTVYISHADCINDANKLKSILQNHYSADVRLITDIGPVIGAHSGPGTLALFFVGKER